MAHSNSDICVWPQGPEACEADTHGCFPCKLRGWSEGGGLQVSPAATPTKTRRFGKLGPKGNASWERPVVTDNRGMPLLKPDGEPIRQKEYAERRHSIEDARRRMVQEPAPSQQ